MGPSGSKSKKKSEMSPPAPLGPGVQKVQNGVENESRSTIFKTILTRFGLRFGLLGPRGREAPGTNFQICFSALGPKGPNDPCSRQMGSKT